MSGYYYPVPRPAAALAALPAAPVLGHAIRYTVVPVLGALLAPGLIAEAFDPAPVPPRFAAGFPIGLTLRPGHIRASAEDSGLLMPSAAAFERRYGELRLPVAIVAGAEDRIVDTRLHSIRLHHEVPGSTLWVVPGQGHMVHHDAAGVVADAIEVVAIAARQGSDRGAVRLPCPADQQSSCGGAPFRDAACGPCAATMAHSDPSRRDTGMYLSGSTQDPWTWQAVLLAIAAVLVVLVVRLPPAGLEVRQCRMRSLGGSREVLAPHGKHGSPPAALLTSDFRFRQ